jgi:hypothetical protein
MGHGLLTLVTVLTSGVTVPIRHSLIANNLSLAVEKPGNLLSAVNCLRYLTINGSTQTALFEAQARELGLWDRITVQTGTPDPEGKEAGCFRGHVKAWNDALDEGCSNLLVMEEDVFFDRAVVWPTFNHLNGFLNRNASSYDMLFLGWDFSSSNIPATETTASGANVVSSGYTTVHPTPGYRCIWNIHNWLDTRAYVISRHAPFPSTTRTQR